MKFTNNEEDHILTRSEVWSPYNQGSVLQAAVLEEVRSHYNQGGRYYHDWQHALSVLSWVNHVCDVFPETALAPFTHFDLRLAALFHDVIYDTQGSPSNEERSAALLTKLVDGSYRGIGPAEEIILATAKHGKLESKDVPLATALFMDCDIASFGEMRWEIAVWNDQNITMELLQRYTPEQVATGRKAFLGGMLAKNSIFLSDHFRVRFESQARLNIQNLIQLL